MRLYALRHWQWHFRQISLTLTNDEPCDSMVEFIIRKNQINLPHIKAKRRKMYKSTQLMLHVAIETTVGGTWLTIPRATNSMVDSILMSIVYARCSLCKLMILILYCDHLKWWIKHALVTHDFPHNSNTLFDITSSLKQTTTNDLTSFNIKQKALCICKLAAAANL